MGHKPPAGHRRLHLYLESASKHEAASAIKEIKRNIEELVVSNSRSAAGRAGGSG